MKCIAWNVRGLNKVNKKVEFRNFCRRNKAAILVVLEHKIKEGKAGKIIQKMVGNSQAIHHGYVTTQSSRFYLTRVYGMHTIADRKHLWTGLTQVTNAVTEPLVIVGDFNSILHGDDRFGGNAVMDGEVQDFKKFIETTSMIGMRCLGRIYTWTNGHIHRKIDWILTNATWVHKWEHIQGLIMEPLFSDHCADRLDPNKCYLGT
ncbi:hypothetical protein H5410_046830 [Solanum commersonii]|uniref:Endonuclease/exonuclease/phosphatase domain-containing protein n=1 Tax=Solanum commersonii TaxID=4109 RepID=A0A9J5XGL6_SOLCO|nr:hypothetical protein H5410_046830 [Solanum commersonii]